MITKDMEAFVYTAKIGSFQKTSELLFISSTALIKRINTLEEEIGFTLFNRTNKDLTLTQEGSVFLDVAIDILQRYYNGIQAAKAVSAEQKHPLRFGISYINPYVEFPFENYFGTSEFPHFTCYMMPISCEYPSFSTEFMNLGGNIDVIPYFLGNKYLDAFCDSFCIAKIPMRVAVPRSHPLAGKETLKLSDLNGCDLITISSDINSYYAQFNQFITNNAPNVNLRNCAFIDSLTLNYAAHDLHLILVGDYLKSAHPLLKLIPVEWDLLLPYGILYAKKPSDAVKLFIRSFNECGITGNVDSAPVVEFS